MVLADALVESVAAAIDRRSNLLGDLHRGGTDCYRLLHGVAEGVPGLTIDRYGGLLLLQTFRTALAHDDVAAIGGMVDRALGTRLAVACNHRGEPCPPDFPHHVPEPRALDEQLAREAGIAFHVRARHRGQDPWLFLDLRAGRALVRESARDRTVLNLFAYTCGAGVVAAAAGAASVLNVDFAASALAVGERNAAINGVAGPRFRTLHSDCIPVLRQLAGLPVQRRGRRAPFAPVPRQQFDLVFLDPPRWAKGPFGAVDVRRDYQSLFKPCLAILAEGGLVLATNHLPEVTPLDFRDLLVRCAAKAGRPLRAVEVLGPGPDFPAIDGLPPFKLAVCRV